MRFIVGILIGFAIVIGGAYFHDQSMPEPGQRVVNWEVAGNLTRAAVDRVREEFDKLIAR